MTSTPLGAEERLALAVDAARLGSWMWDIATGVTTWDERLEEMHGLPPGGFGGTFEDWLAAIHPEDRAECVARVEEALLRPGPYTLLHRAIWPDGSVHTLECRGTVLVDEHGRPTGTTGVAIDVTTRERLVSTLQQTLLPYRLPTVDGVALATRYLPAEGVEIGGDWYASAALSGGRLGLGVGDVAGHGLDAVSHMASARFSLRALALRGDEPERVVEQLSAVVRTFEADTMITALYGILDPGKGTWTYCSAGHMPALLCRPGEDPLFIDDAVGPPLGVESVYSSRQVEVRPGDALVLFTDGLIERRSEAVDVGLERLRTAARGAPTDPDHLCDWLTERLLDDQGHVDDVALVCALVR